MGSDSVLASIHSHMFSLTPSEAKAAEFCRNNPEKVLSGSIHDVAREAGVSVASVSRLAATLGYRDWKEMRLAMVRDVQTTDNPVYPEIDADDSDAAAIKKVFNGNVQSLRDTYEGLDQELVVKVVQAVVASDRVVFFGSGGSGYLAKDEALRFSHLEVAAEAYTEEYQMMIQASRMRAGQVAFGFSNSGRSRATVMALREARHNGAMTVGIANFRGTPVEGAADVFFCTSFASGGGITASLTARISLLCIMDVVYAICVQYGRMRPDVMRLNMVLEDNLRFSRKSGGGRAKRKK